MFKVPLLERLEGECLSLHYKNDVTKVLSRVCHIM